MKLVSSIGAIYLGIYLILPACLCQLLAAFGVNFHGSLFPEGPCELSEGNSSIVCHCDDHVAKSVEPDLSRPEAPAFVDAAWASLSETSSNTRQTNAEHRLVARGPPGSRDRDSHRAFSGVFLI